MFLFDQASGLMDGFAIEAALVDFGLKSLVENFADCKTQNVIEFEFFTGQKSISMHSSEKCGSYID